MKCEFSLEKRNYIRPFNHVVLTTNTTDAFMDPEKGLIIQVLSFRRENYICKKDGKWIIELECTDKVYLVVEIEEGVDIRTELIECQRKNKAEWEYLWNIGIEHTEEIIMKCIESWKNSEGTAICRWILDGCPIETRTHFSWFLEWPENIEPGKWLEDTRGRRTMKNFGI